jgi:hypothetical protein
MSIAAKPPGILLDHVGGLFGDHDRRGVGVAGRDAGHHRGVDDGSEFDDGRESSDNGDGAKYHADRELLFELAQSRLKALGCFHRRAPLVKSDQRAKQSGHQTEAGGEHYSGPDG